MALSGKPKNEASVCEQHQSTCCLLQANAKLVQFHKPTFVSKEKCSKIGTTYVTLFEVLDCKQSKAGRCMNNVATTQMVEKLHTTTAHEQQETRYLTHTWCQ